MQNKKSVPVFTMDQIASVSADEIMRMARRWTIERIRAFPEDTREYKFSFFVKTQTDVINLKFPPRIEVEIVSPLNRGRL